MIRMLFMALLLVSPLSYAELTQEDLKEILAPRIEGLKFLTKNGMLLQAIREQKRLERSCVCTQAPTSASVPLRSFCALAAATSARATTLESIVAA